VPTHAAVPRERRKIGACFRAVRRRARRRARDGYIACSLIANASGASQTENSADTLREGGETTWCRQSLPWISSSSLSLWWSRSRTAASSP